MFYGSKPLGLGEFLLSLVLFCQPPTHIHTSALALCPEMIPIVYKACGTELNLQLQILSTGRIPGTK